MSHNADNLLFNELFKTYAGKKIFPRAICKELQFEDYLPYILLLDDDKTIQAQSRQLIQCIRLDGFNAATALDETIDGVKRLFAGIIANSDDHFSYYVHKISRPIKFDASAIKVNKFAEDCDQAWNNYLTASSPRDVALTITIISTPSMFLKIGGLVQKFRRLRKGKENPEYLSAYHADITERRAQLSEMTALLVSSFADSNARVLKAANGELLGFLESIGTGTETKAYPLKERAALARSVCNYRPTSNGTNITISGGSVSTRVGRIFSIKSYPRVSFSGIFDEMRLPLDMVITNSFVPISDDKAKELMRRNIAHRASINDVAGIDLQQMEDGQSRVASGIEKLGYHHMTIALYSDDQEQLDRACSELRAIAQEAGAKLITEPFASMGHYFAQWPGNAAYRSRTGLISNRVFAGMASLHCSPSGLKGQSLPWRTPITAFPTTDGSLYNFSFHPKGSPDEEPPAAHTIMFGASGSGKTVMINFLVAQAARAGVQTFHFDHLRHAEVSVRALEGSYSAISPSLPTGLNPLATQIDEEGKAWLNDWLLAILDRNDQQLTPLQRQAISDAVNANAEAPAHLRTFANFAQLMRHVDDNGDLQQRIAEWCIGGRYGWAFANNQTEEFAVTNPVMAFDMTYVLDHGQEKEKTAILGYLFRVIEAKLSEKKPTLIIIDEGWNALNTEYFARKLEKWLFTARKLNAVVMVATQFPSQVNDSSIKTTMLQAFRTRIILPSKDASLNDYRELGLSERELVAVTTPQKNSWLALIRNDREKVIVNTSLKSLGQKLLIIGGGPAGEKALNDYISGNNNA